MNLGKLYRRLKRLIKQIILAIGKRVGFVRTGSRAFYAWSRSRRYERMCRQNPVDARVVIFECYAGRSYACSPRALYRAMLADERYRDYELIWVFRPRLARSLTRWWEYRAGTLEEEYDIEGQLDVERVLGAEALEELSHASIVRYGSPDYYLSRARAGLWIANNIVPTHMNVREGQTYLQTWHGTPLKRLGCDLQPTVKNATYSVDEIHRRYLAEGERFTYLVSPSPFATEKLSSAFALDSRGMHDKIIEEGYPRNDVLKSASDEQAGAIKRRLGIPEGKRTILYAPTWRDDQHSSAIGYTFDVEADFDLLHQHLGDGYVVLFRAHYLVANEFDFDRFEGFVFDVSDITDINDLYVISDLLITDYSSVFFDYANLQRPMIFYMYDLERYADELRGFYLQLDELPGPVVRTEPELVEAIRAAEHEDAERAEALRRFAERFSGLDDGHASERVLRRIIAPAQDMPAESGAKPDRESR